MASIKMISEEDTPQTKSHCTQRGVLLGFVLLLHGVSAEYVDGEWERPDEACHCGSGSVNHPG
jgi:hypothetical protein